jgi:hypothetical protein
MPYRRAYIWILLLLPLTALAFWPSYFGRLTRVSWILHAHGVTASLWLALTAIQSWSIQQGRHQIHGVMGRASRYLFPLFWVSGLLIVQLMATGFVVRDNPFHSMYGARLTPVDLLTSAGVLYLYCVALMNRRRVMVHASAMLAIVLFLIPPILVRLLQIDGPLAIHGPEDFPKFGYGLQISNGLCVLIALWLYVRSGRRAWPFLAAAVVIVAQSLVFETVGRSDAWESLMPMLANIAVSALSLVGITVAGVAIWRASATKGLRPLPGGASVRRASK